MQTEWTNLIPLAPLVALLLAFAWSHWIENRRP
jgi:hypothetical protein